MIQTGSRRRFLAGALGLTTYTIPTTALSMVIRHDIPDEQYVVPENFFPALVDLPDEGHGVLIAPHWVLTAAHAARWAPQVTLAGKQRAVSTVIAHPEYTPIGQIEMKGDAEPLMARFRALRDIALIKLAEPVTDVEPVPLYRHNNEKGRLAMLLGKGATGDGLSGQPEDAPHRGKLRRAHNRINLADERWIAYRFDRGRSAHALEAMLGNGDSGSPALIKDNGLWKVAGVTNWRSWKGDLAEFRGGVYGQSGYASRVSFYAPWIDSVISPPGSTR